MYVKERNLLERMAEVLKNLLYEVEPIYSNSQELIDGWNILNEYEEYIGGEQS